MNQLWLLGEAGPDHYILGNAQGQMLVGWKQAMDQLNFPLLEPQQCWAAAVEVLDPDHQPLGLEPQAAQVKVLTVHLHSMQVATPAGWYALCAAFVQAPGPTWLVRGKPWKVLTDSTEDFIQGR